ncbi:MAG: hypothetical protein ACRBB3_09135 [Alphaproteobacteria bacterium]
MIAELFYPYELKRVVRGLRKENDLNEEALKTLNFSFNYVYLPLLIFNLLVFVIQYFNPTFGVNIPLGGVVAVFFVMVIHMGELWRSYFYSYLFGNKSFGIVKKVRFLQAGVVRFYIIS